MPVPLSDAEILRFFDKPGLRSKFSNVISKDEIGQVKPNKCYIINLVNSNETRMGHWVALSDLNPKYCIYFDSYGMPPPIDVEQWMKKTRKICVYSTLRIQKINSILCGYYCIDVLIELMKDSSLENFLNILYSLKHN